jgi:hypothetical protein
LILNSPASLWRPKRLEGVLLESEIGML